MGYAKYYEDNERITIERNYEREIVIPFAPKKIYYDCYYCYKSFDSFEFRNTHIKENHNVVGPLLFINGKIASGENFVDKINSANIALCGFIDIAISINNQKIENETTDLDLISYFNNQNTNYIIKIGQNTFIIYKYNNINISSSEIDKIINVWEIQIGKSKSLNPSQESYPEAFNEAEKRYLNGFFDYFTACKTTIASEDKKNRYETAFALLSSFNSLTPKARVLLKVITFRFNWIEKLEHLSNAIQAHGVFEIVLDFYYGRESASTEKECTEEKEQELFVENDVEECLNAILAYQNKKFDLVDTFLAKWTDEELLEIKDINKKDRILFLKARHKKDKKYFNDIRTPFFKRIAEVENIKKIWIQIKKRKN